MYLLFDTSISKMVTRQRKSEMKINRFQANGLSSFLMFSGSIEKY